MEEQVLSRAHLCLIGWLLFSAEKFTKEDASGFASLK
jgi:hypothetical protein